MKHHRYPTTEQVRELEPIYSRSVPADWEDLNGHVNVQYYLRLYEEAGWPLLKAWGLDKQTEHPSFSIFDLEQHLSYLAEMHVGDEVSLHNRVVALSQKRFHGLFFVVNDSRDQVACIIEYISSGADLKLRRTTPLIPQLATYLEQAVELSKSLTWPAPLCGIMSA